MIHYILDNHTNACINMHERLKENPKWMPFSSYCQMETDDLLFFLGNDFYLVTFYKCNYRKDNRLNYKYDLITKIIDNNKIFDFYKIYKDYDVNTTLRNFRIRGKSLKKYVQNIHYIYQEGYHKKYCITSQANYIDKICDNDIIIDNYYKAKKYLIEIGLESLIYQLDELYSANTYYVDNAQIVLTTDHLIKLINQQTA
jgi:hypothetical protein